MLLTSGEYSVYSSYTWWFMMELILNKGANMKRQFFFCFALAISLSVLAQGAFAGLSGSLILSPAPTPYAPQTVGTTSTAQAFVLSNNDENAVINSISTTGDFARSGTCTAGTLLLIGQNCTTPVTFTPTATGARVGSLVINCSAVAGAGTVLVICNGINQIIALSGTGLAAIGQQAPIPTLGQWAMTAMAGFILIVAMLRLRQQRR